MRQYPETQIEAWESIQDKLPESRREVLHVIAAAGALGISTVAISETLKWPINCVSGRITELHDSGLVKDSGRRCINPSGKRAILWVAGSTEPEIKFDDSGQRVFA